LINCTAYGNAQNGFLVGSPSSQYYTLLQNCISEGNTGAGFSLPSTADSIYLNNCATYNNGSSITGAFNNLNPIAYTASAFTNAAGGDFSLNNTAGGGAALRGMGAPGPFPGGMTGYADVGALQSQAPTAGGLLVNPGMGGGARG
jgi:hypothetical protein